MLKDHQPISGESHKNPADSAGVYKAKKSTAQQELKNDARLVHILLVYQHHTKPKNAENALHIQP